MHWRRLVENMGETNILWEVKDGNNWAFFNYWGHVPGLPPKSTLMCVCACAFACPSVYVRVPLPVSLCMCVCLCLSFCVRVPTHSCMYVHYVRMPEAET